MKKIKSKRKIYDLPFEVILTIISAGIYSLAFPSIISDTGYPIFAIFALIPLIISINRTRWVYSSLLGIIWGISFFIMFNYWLTTFHPYSILLVTVLRSIQLIFLFPIFKIGYHLPKKYKVLFQASLYPIYMFIMQQGFLGYPYGNLSSAFSSWTPLIQVASITGQWAIGFFMIVPQIFVANYFVKRYKDKRNNIPKIKDSFFIFLSDNSIFIIMYSILMMINLVFGIYTIEWYSKVEPSSEIKIATIQHNSDTWLGGYNQYKKNYLTMRDLTIKAMEENPSMVVWSETAFVPSVEWHTNYPSSRMTSSLVSDFVTFGKSLPVPLITGNPEGIIKEGSTEPFDKDGNWNRDDYNSVILFENGELKDTYKKQHLVPFTEYFPYGNIFPKFNEFLNSNDFHFWLPGNESKTFNYNGLIFSTSICFEDIFPDITRNFTKNGSSLFLNLSNDSWSKSVSAEMQHLYLGSYRSIENRRATVKSTNSGITCLILPTGEIIDPMEPFVADYNIYNAPVYTQNDFGLTFYTKHGEWFIYLMYLLDVTYIFYIIFDKIIAKGKIKKDKNYIQE
jgi:apolipoprotein N-acyltransferase